MTTAETVETIEPAGTDVSRRRFEPHLALAWVAVFVAPAVFQLKYGLRDVGLVEEWGVNQLFDVRGTVFWAPHAPQGSGLRTQAIRPLTVAPHSLAFLLDPNSFAWYHLINAAALGLKGAAMLYLLLQLRIRRSIAIASAFVFAIFPAWTGLFSFRMIHGEIALAALVFAVGQLIAYSRAPSRSRAITLGAALALSLLMYEVGYLIVILVPALLFVVGRFDWRQFLHRAAVWYVVPFVNGIRILLLFHSGQKLYERDLVIRTARRPIEELTDLVSMVYKRGLWNLVDGPMGLGVSLVAVLMIGLVGAAIVVAWRTRTRSGGERRDLDGAPSDRRMLGLLVACMIATPLVALIYAPNPAHLEDPLRVFSVASFPLGLAVAAVLELLARRQDVVATAVAIALVVLAAASGDAQRDVWHERSQFQENLLGAVAQAAAGAGQATSIIVIDPGHVVGPADASRVYRFLPEILRLAVEYVRPPTSQLLVCDQGLDAMPVGTSTTPQCSIEGGVVTSYLGSAPIATSAVIEIRAAAQPRWPVATTRLPSHRERALLHCVAAESCDDGANGVEARLLPIGAGA